MNNNTASGSSAAAVKTERNIKRGTKGCYIRPHSVIIRRWRTRAQHHRHHQHHHHHQHEHHEYIEEDRAVEGLFGLARYIMLIVCRNRCRVLKQAWNYWVRNTEIVHDYSKDVRTILARAISSKELRSELEIEVMCKWVAQQAKCDPTGIAYNLMSCKSMSSIIAVLQHCRLESYMPGDTIIFQGTLPRAEDGHFTILVGECDVLQFAEESLPFIKLQEFAKHRKYDDAKRLLNSVPPVATLYHPAGFGELSTLTGVKRGATIRASTKTGKITDIIVVPKPALLDCLLSRRDIGIEGSEPSEAIELFRQFGLANRIAPKDLMAAAGSMVKRILYRGDVLYCKGEPAKTIFLVVSGDFVLDAGTYKQSEGGRKVQPFSHSDPNYCYTLSAGSILGDEGVVGLESNYDSTAAVVSDVAIIFEAVGFGLRFLTERIKLIRYAALSYRDMPRWSAPLHLAESNNLYANFNSLRKAIAFCKPYRGTVDDIVIAEDISDKTALEEKQMHKKKGNEGSRVSSLKEKRVSIKSRASLSKSKVDPKSTEENYPYLRLNPTTLAHAKSMCALAKKAAFEQIKIQARDNIIAHEVHIDKGKEDEAISSNREERDATEKKLNRSIVKYRERTMLKAQSEELEEEHSFHMAQVTNPFIKKTCRVSFFVIFFLHISSI